MKASRFAVLAIVFALIGLGVWFYISNQATEISYTKVQNKSWQYQVDTPGKGWFDTGMWVTPNKEIYAGYTNQPFSLAVGGSVVNARLLREQFHAGIWTTDLKTGGRYAYVKNQDKIYFYTDRPMTIGFSVEDIDADHKKEIQDTFDKRQKGEPSDWLVTLGIGLLILLLMLGANFAIRAIRARP